MGNKTVTSSLVIVVDSEERLLLQHRTADAPTNPSKWQLWGGACENNESPLETACRELKEELALDLPVEQLSFFEKQDQGAYDCAAIFILHLPPQCEINLGEGDGYGFFSLDAAFSLDLESTTKAALSNYRDQVLSISQLR